MFADPLMSWEHIITAFAGATAMGLLAHAVNTFPTPVNKYGQWFLGCIKFAVGQRISAMNAFAGKDTMVVAVPQGMGGSAPGVVSDQKREKTAINPDGSVTTESAHLTKSSQTLPPPPEESKG